MEVELLDEGDVSECAALWHAVGLTRPWNDPEADARRAMAGPASAVLGVRRAGRLVATVMVGHDGHRGWVYYLSVDTDHRGRGLARALMSTAEDWLRSRDVVKAQLMVRHSNAQAMGFYERIGYEREGVTVLSRWLDEDAEASARPAAVTP